MAGSRNNNRSATAPNVLVVAAVIVACFSVGIEMADAKSCSGSADDFGYANAVTHIVTEMALVTPGRTTFSYSTTYDGKIAGRARCSKKEVQACTDCLGRLKSQLSSCTSSAKGSCSESDCRMSFHKL